MIDGQLKLREGTRGKDSSAGIGAALCL